MACLSISLLGTLSVTRDGEPVTGFATDKARALLAYLAVEADRPHRRDTLAGLLWPDQPRRRARQSLRQALSELRKAIGDGDDASFLLVSRESMQFDPDCDHRLDVADFTALIKDCGAHHHRCLAACLPCIRRMARAVDLYSGPFLEQFFLGDSDVFEEWALLKREWLQREMTEALSCLADYHQRRGEYRQAQQYARRQVQIEPWREEAHRQLMRLLALDGKRSAALAWYETCRRALAEDLGVEPTTETQALYEAIRAQGHEPEDAEEALPSPARLSASLDLSAFGPAFVGREVERAELAEMLANPDCRLVTLFGPGGIGKSRLALQVAAEHLGVFEDGVTFVSLAHIDAVEHVVPAIASSLGIVFHGDQDLQAQLIGYLRQRQQLLVLDNVEHILECTLFLSLLLQQASGVILLVTSRERLNLREEWVYRVGGLAYPKDDELPQRQFCGAVELFSQHARRASPHFVLDQKTLPHVVHICQLVEGMPLAVELAAAWVGVRSCAGIAQEIGRSLDSLETRLRNVPERHRSIRATFEHSWRLVSPPEQALLAQLSVFRGSFGRDAAVAVTGTELPVFWDLLDKALIRQVAPDRYDMHQLLHQYAAEKLQSMPALCEAAQVQHAQHFLAFLDRQRPRLKTAEHRQALAAIGLEIENVRLAWNVAISRGWAGQVAQGIESIYQFCDVHGRLREGIELIGQAIDRWRDVPRCERVFGMALARQAALFIKLSDYDRAQAGLEESLSIFQQLDATGEQILSALHLLRVLVHRGTYDRAQALAAETLALSRRLSDPWLIARALELSGLVCYRQGDVDRAQVLYEESLVLSRKIGHDQLTLWSLNTLADIACHRGDFDRAQGLFDECIALARSLGDAYHEAIHLNNQATVLHVLEDYRAAEKLFQSSLEICRRISDRTGEAIALSNLGKVAHELGDYQRALARCREGLAIGREVGDQWSLISCLSNLGRTACAVDEDEAARAYLVEALSLASEAQTSPVQTEILMYLGVFFAKHDRRDRAAELLALTSQHPASELDIKERAERLLTELDLTPPQGAPRSLAVVTTEVLATLGHHQG